MTVHDLATLGLVGCALMVIALVADWFDDAFVRAHR